MTVKESLPPSFRQRKVVLLPHPPSRLTVWSVTVAVFPVTTSVTEKMANVKGAAETAYSWVCAGESLQVASG